MALRRSSCVATACQPPSSSADLAPTAMSTFTAVITPRESCFTVEKEPSGVSRRLTDLSLLTSCLVLLLSPAMPLAAKDDVSGTQPPAYSRTTSDGATQDPEPTQEGGTLPEEQGKLSTATPSTDFTRTFRLFSRRDISLRLRPNTGVRVPRLGNKGPIHVCTGAHW